MNRFHSDDSHLTEQELSQGSPTQVLQWSGNAQAGVGCWATAAVPGGREALSPQYHGPPKHMWVPKLNAEISAVKNGGGSYVLLGLGTGGVQAI